MCGIFGVISRSCSKISSELIKDTIIELATQSISRGKDSSGMVFKDILDSELIQIKGDISIYELLKNEKFKTILNQQLEKYEIGNVLQVMGHARLVTNGSQLKHYNNQPVTKDKITIIHNGIIVNDNALWEKHHDIRREFDIDTEILPSLIRKYINNGESKQTALSLSMQNLDGTVSAAFMLHDENLIGLCTNNGSLYYVLTSDIFIFASEEYFLKQLRYVKEFQCNVKKLLPNNALFLDTINFHSELFYLFDKSSVDFKTEKNNIFTITEILLDGNFKKETVIDPMEFINRSKEQHFLDIIQDNSNHISYLRRCSRCILPETFPFIHFDKEGICNYCNNYTAKRRIKSLEELKKLVEPYRSKDGSPDCIVPFSGGRDSTYTLHIVKKELGMNPIAFTYDWGMVTDLARRNIARVCGKLGVENIMVSADIKWKRENIRKNIEAWLKHPHLGMIPLFMAGDKYFFYYCNQLKKQTGIRLNIWGINDLENTNFKSGFAGLHPQFNKKRIYSLSIINQVKLFGFVAKNLLQSPGYINSSIFDSLGSFAVRYIFPKKDYYHLFDYYPWNESELEKLIKEEYNWEKAIDTDSTWRIGDGTASFYNYIYYTVAGFTENDTFRSNQIREGMISRQQALLKVNKENEVRYETLRWYLEIIGLDFRSTISKINSIPKLYNTTP